MQICMNCGSHREIEEIKAVWPDALSCCPERKMVDVDVLDMLKRLKKVEQTLARLTPF